MKKKRGLDIFFFVQRDLVQNLKSHIAIDIKKVSSMAIVILYTIGLISYAVHNCNYCGNDKGW